MARKNDNSAVTAAPTHEPGSDWVPLALAPFHYFGKTGYIRTEDEMREAFQRLVADCTIQSPLPPRISGEPVQHPPKIEWSLEWRGSRIPEILAQGMRLFVFPDTGSIFLRGVQFQYDDGRLQIGIEGTSFDDFVSHESWRNVPEEQQEAAGWFRSLAFKLREVMQNCLAVCVKSGAAHVMVRKHSPLAPFERVWPDQWTYFKVNSFEPMRTLDTPWFDPRAEEWFNNNIPVCTATGPNGEKLYSMHVAPGTPRGLASNTSAEERCLTYLLKEMMRSPECPPGGTKGALHAKCLEMFDGLTGRGFEHAFREAKRITGSAVNWSKPGPKSATKFPAVENSTAVISGRVATKADK